MVYGRVVVSVSSDAAAGEVRVDLRHERWVMTLLVRPATALRVSLGQRGLPRLPTLVLEGCAIAEAPRGARWAGGEAERDVAVVRAGCVLWFLARHLEAGGSLSAPASGRADAAVRAGIAAAARHARVLRPHACAAAGALAWVFAALDDSQSSAETFEQQVRNRLPPLELALEHERVYNQPPPPPRPRPEPFQPPPRPQPEPPRRKSRPAANLAPVHAKVREFVERCVRAAATVRSAMRCIHPDKSAWIADRVGDARAEREVNALLTHVFGYITANVDGGPTGSARVLDKLVADAFDAFE
jgi:hypothetical protein